MRILIHNLCPYIPSKADGFMVTISSRRDFRRNVIVAHDRDLTSVSATVGGSQFLLDAMPWLFFPTIKHQIGASALQTCDLLSLDKFYWTTSHSSFDFVPSKNGVSTLAPLPLHPPTTRVPSLHTRVDLRISLEPRQTDCSCINCYLTVSA